MTKRITTATFTLLDRVRANTTVQVNVVPTGRGFTAEDPTHLRFNATFKTEKQANVAAFLAMARRAR